MKEEDTLYARWLSGDITPEELQQLQNDGSLEALEKIVSATDQWSLPKYDTTAGLKSFREKRIAKEVPVRNLNWKWIGSIAAGFLILVFVGYNLAFNNGEAYLAENGSTMEVNPGDGSTITLNDGSSINYDYSDWEDERRIELEGEALFDVEKGIPFIVTTEHGEIQVLGTQFNVRSWGINLAVACYEGRVKVSSQGQEVILAQGESVEVIDGLMSNKQSALDKNPSWLNGISKFTNEEANEVFAEFERQYDVKVNLPDIQRRFTGSFSHDNLENAVRNICKPLGLQYVISADGRSIRIETQ